MTDKGRFGQLPPATERQESAQPRPGRAHYRMTAFQTLNSHSLPLSWPSGHAPNRPYEGEQQHVPTSVADRGNEKLSRYNTWITNCCGVVDISRRSSTENQLISCSEISVQIFVSRMASRTPNSRSSRCSALRRNQTSGIMTGVMARSRTTISRASSSRPIWA